MGLARGIVERGAHCRIWRKGFALFYPERAELIDHYSIALKPRLGLHNVIKILIEAGIVVNGRVEQRARCIHKLRRRRFARRGEWVTLDLPAVVYRLRNVLVGVAAEV